LLRDLRFAWRLFRAAPGASLAVSGVLGLAMATTAAVFILVDALLLRPLPVEDQDRILHLGGLTWPPGDAVAWWGQAPSLEAVATYASGEVNLEGEGDARTARVAAVSSEFFRVFQVRSTAGRTFGKADETPGLNRVVVLSERFRRFYFPNRPAPLGAEIRLNGIAHAVVGILPDGFDYPSATQGWIPRPAAPAAAGELVLAPVDSLLHRRTEGWVGRLRPWASAAHAKRDLEILQGRLRDLYTNTGPPHGHLSTTSMTVVARCRGDCNGSIGLVAARLRGAVVGLDVRRSSTLASLVSRLTHPARARALISGVYAAVVFGVALVGVYTLVSYLSLLRRRELSVRMALGASPRQIVLLVAGEGLLLTGLGVLLRGFASILGAGLLRTLLFGVEALSPGVIAATGATLLAGAVTASLIPALQASRRHPSEVLEVQLNPRRSSVAASAASRAEA
jgi:putative ABC transport system permease protein